MRALSLLILDPIDLSPSSERWTLGSNGMTLGSESVWTEIQVRLPTISVTLGNLIKLQIVISIK